MRKYEKEFKFQLSSGIVNVELNAPQLRFMNSDKKYVLYSGGYGSGKSLALILKAWELCEDNPGNYILMGRKTYIELRDALMKDFFNTVPAERIYEFKKSENRVVFTNGSEIIFRHLDVIAESEIRSLNLGGAFIDQAEDISQEVFLGLKGRLRRDCVKDNDRRIYMSCNPALTWLFEEFKRNPKPEYDLIESSTLDNEKNLPKEYVVDLLNYPESYKQQFVYGVWDESLMSDKIVFAREHVQKLQENVRVPLKTYEGLEIFKEFVKGHEYQMGVDSSEGNVEHLNPLKEKQADSAAIAIADLTTEEEVASWSGKVPPDVLGEKVNIFANLYQDSRNRCLIVPEMNSIGLALLTKLKQFPDLRVYQREEHDKRLGKKLLKLGWRMTVQSKPLLISRFQELLRLRNPKVYSQRTVDEFKSFVWSDEARKSGAGAQRGFHDDRIISVLLAFWKKEKVQPASVKSADAEIRSEEKEFVKNHPMLAVKNKRLVLRGFDRSEPLLQIERSWTIV